MNCSLTKSPQNEHFKFCFGVSRYWPWTFKPLYFIRAWVSENGNNFDFKIKGRNP
jgi:hypothetical protein